MHVSKKQSIGKKTTNKQLDKQVAHGKIKYRLRKQMEEEGTKLVREYRNENSRSL